MEEIENAAREAHAHQFIINMPNAYHTVIGNVYVQQTFYRYRAFNSKEENHGIGNGCQISHFEK